MSYCSKFKHISFNLLYQNSSTILHFNDNIMKSQNRIHLYQNLVCINVFELYVRNWNKYILHYKMRFCSYYIYSKFQWKINILEAQFTSRKTFLIYWLPCHQIFWLFFYFLQFVWISCILPNHFIEGSTMTYKISFSFVICTAVVSENRLFMQREIRKEKIFQKIVW